MTRHKLRPKIYTFNLNKSVKNRNTALRLSVTSINRTRKRPKSSIKISN